MCRTYQSLWIDGPLPGLNELFGKALNPKAGTYRYGAEKRKWETIIGWAIKMCKLRPIDRARFEFKWSEKARNRDPDNISSGGRKLILDALVRNDILPNDGWAQVLGWVDEFEVSKKPGVMVKIYAE